MGSHSQRRNNGQPSNIYSEPPYGPSPSSSSIRSSGMGDDGGEESIVYGDDMPEELEDLETLEKEKLLSSENAGWRTIASCWSCLVVG